MNDDEANINFIKPFVLKFLTFMNVIFNFFKNLKNIHLILLCFALLDIIDTVCFYKLKFCGNPLEKEMATHSSTLACRIPGMEEPGELPSMGSHRVRHD